MNAAHIIRKKRDGLELSPLEIHTFVEKAVLREFPDYQVAAFLMAIFHKGMSLKETIAMTQSFVQSGEQFSFPGIPVDKHSTGGVGDKISIILAPLAASLGLKVPMISGRGLGHTGGTLDKLESIPGFRVRLSPDEFKEGVETVGAVIAGQTETMVPADKLFYSLRDVTATVECVPLITSSILSKKIAEGAKGLVLDLKTGDGAFMPDLKRAKELRSWLEKVAQKLGLKIKVLLTEMHQPLGNAVGHSVEIIECIETLEGKGPKDVFDLTVEFAAWMQILAKTEKNISIARKKARENLKSGAALSKFFEVLKNQGYKGTPDQLRSSLPRGSQRFVFTAKKSGKIKKIHTRKMGEFLATIGGGRQKATDTIDFGVGILLHKKLGDKVTKGEKIATLEFSKSIPDSKIFEDLFHLGT